MADKTCAAVIVAAGTASRMGGIDKIFHPIDGRLVIAHSLSVFDSLDFITQIIIVAKEQDKPRLEQVCAGLKTDVQIVLGGLTRAHSVLNGVSTVRTDFAAIHDGARPFVTRQVVEDAFFAAVEHGSAAPCVPVFDTVKLVEQGKIVKTLDRDKLFLVQTPQIFERGLILNALEQAVERGVPITDDCSAVEALGLAVHMTKGDKGNIKITTPEDLER